jgi:probable phosphoglycerate mutase
MAELLLGKNRPFINSSFDEEKLMEIFVIRHAYPDYENDSLTERGREEAQLLAERLKDVRIDHIYASPMGRAHLTMEYTAKAKEMEFTVLDWLREVDPVEDNSPWDADPREILDMPRLPREEDWAEEVSFGPDYKPIFEEIKEGSDALLAKHGYVREGRVYRIEKSNTDVLALFSHNGMIRTLFSYLFNSAFPVFKLHFHISPSGLSFVRFKEINGYAIPELRTFNDITHLDARRKPKEDKAGLPFAYYG